MKKYQCIVCGWIYDEAEGWLDDGIAPGTRWEDVPDDWICPECGTPKSDFEMVEIGYLGVSSPGFWSTSRVRDFVSVSSLNLATSWPTL